MADVKGFSERLIDLSERFADVVDAAEGKGSRRSGGSGARWLILPAAGAAVYAFATGTSRTARQTRKLVRRAKDRATDLPDSDLFNRVKEVSGLTEESSSSPRGRTQRSSSSSRRKSGTARTSSQRRRKTTASSR
jgi:hypothetical protein